MNVIKFPKENPRINAQETLSDVQKKIDKAKEKYVNSLVDHHCSQLLAGISLSGIEIETDEFMKDFAFTVETVRSSMYRSMGIEHPLHEQIDEAIDVVEAEEEETEFTMPPMVFDDEDDE